MLKFKGPCQKAYGALIQTAQGGGWLATAAEECGFESHKLLCTFRLAA